MWEDRSYNIWQTLVGGEGTRFVKNVDTISGPANEDCHFMLCEWEGDMIGYDAFTLWCTWLRSSWITAGEWPYTSTLSFFIIAISVVRRQFNGMVGIPE